MDFPLGPLPAHTASTAPSTSTTLPVLRWVSKGLTCCPAPGCNHKGKDLRCLQEHLNERHANFLPDVLVDWLELCKCWLCPSCGKVVATQSHNRTCCYCCQQWRPGAHKACKPCAPHAGPREADLGEGLPASLLSSEQPRDPLLSSVNLETLFLPGAPTLDFVPGPCKQQLASLFSDLAFKAAQSASMEDLMPVLALFRLVLVKPPRGGWDKARARAAFTMQRIGLFERRDFASLLPAACACHHLKHNKQARVVG